MNMCLFYCSKSQVQFFFSFFLYHSAPLLRQRRNCLEVSKYMGGVAQGMIAVIVYLFICLKNEGALREMWA